MQLRLEVPIAIPILMQHNHLKKAIINL